MYQIDTYNLSKVWVACVYHQYLVKYGSYDGCLTKYLYDYDAAWHAYGMESRYDVGIH